MYKSDIVVEWAMTVLDNPDLVYHCSLLLGAHLLESQVTRVGKIEPAVAVVRGSKGGPFRRILAEVVVPLPAPGGARGDVHSGSRLAVGQLGVGAGHHRPVIGGQESLIAVLVGPDWQISD